ncbi:hypothetical protein [Nocardioides lianchengensis]|uniref:Uncharacterized protein n=1 Tax=Nocardioides lianchengensis TaxID=1045774 RepID=A0A1G6YJT3_9ACTN|nr:hypothetical protein [Nocardioides lianchengensis]NYG09626.1 hypothetical protein [Nocardioides lianchengensis]SDD90253.1 hypothetical protein SAMN05421872_11264 [Nocardioides lianchengensis]
MTTASQIETIPGITLPLCPTGCTHAAAPIEHEIFLNPQTREIEVQHERTFGNAVCVSLVERVGRVGEYEVRFYVDEDEVKAMTTVAQLQELARDVSSATTWVAGIAESATLRLGTR